MSYALGAENDAILELFSYYDQLKDWKFKLKRRIKSTVLFRRTVSYNEGIITTGRPLKQNDSGVTRRVNTVKDNRPRCASMVELGGGRYNVDSQLVTTASPEKHIGKGLKRSKSLKEKIAGRAGNNELLLRTFLVHLISPVACCCVVYCIF